MGSELGAASTAVGAFDGFKLDAVGATDGSKLNADVLQVSQQITKPLPLLRLFDLQTSEAPLATDTP